MKKVLGTLAIAAVLVAAFPMTASAGNVKPGCGGIFFRPCPNTMPPASKRQPERHALGRRLRHDRHRHGHRLQEPHPHASPGRHAPGRPLSHPTLPSSANRPTQVGRFRFGAMNAIRRTTPGVVRSQR